MPNKNVPPYPTVLKIVWQIALAFDIKDKDKELEKEAKDLHSDYRKDELLIQRVIHDQLEKYINTDFAGIIQKQVSDYTQIYLKIISHVNAEGITREQMLPLLIEQFFSGALIGTLERVVELRPEIKNDSWLSEELSVPMVLVWLDESDSNWKKFTNSLAKEAKDKLSRWKRGDNLPKLSSVSDLKSLESNLSGSELKTWEENKNSVDWTRATTLLLLAQALDYSRNTEFGSALIKHARNYVVGNYTPDKFIHSIMLLHNENIKNYPVNALKTRNNILQIANNTISKSHDDKATLRSNLDTFQEIIRGNSLEQTNGYWLDWQEARYQVYSDNLDKALVQYKKAFEACLYRCGKNQKLIIEEALSVAAHFNKNEKVFLTHLKNAYIKFGYDIPTTINTKGKFDFSEFLEDWEINGWKAEFFRVFPKQGLFPETSYDYLKTNVGPLIISEEKSAPDIRHKDKVTKYGETWKKREPLLIKHTKLFDVDIVKELLIQNADVNKTSDTNDSALLISIELINSRHSTELFELISKQEHEQATVNLLTQKLRKLPIIAAVESGEPWVVEKIIDMGADINIKGTMDNCSALYACLVLIVRCKDPANYLTQVNNAEFTPELADSIRRYSNGQSGMTLSQIQSAFEQKSELFDMVLEAYTEIENNRHSLDKLREIATILINNGANPNQEHKSPINGYTPLMLAAQIDEFDLFNLMLMNDGDPKKSYFIEQANRNINCWDIAENFKSKKVLHLLNQIKENLVH